MSIRYEDPIKQTWLDKYEITTYEELLEKRHLHPILIGIFAEVQETLLRMQNKY